MKLKYCKDCRNARYETKDNEPYVYCRIRKEYVGFYRKRCEEYK